MTVALTILTNLGSAVLLPVFLAAALLGILASFASALGGVAGILTIVFVILRLVGVLDWSWLWVLSPAWIMFACYMLMGIAPHIMRYTAPEFRRVASDHPVIVWTERHPNWTLIVSYIAAFLLAEAVSNTLWLILHVSNVHEAFTEPIRFIGFWFAWWILITMLVVWYLRRKGRGTWHLLWWIPLAVILGVVSVALGIIPLIGVVGVGVLLCLRDKRSPQPYVCQETDLTLKDNADSIVINCGACCRQYKVTRGQGVVGTACPDCGREARIST